MLGFIDLFEQLGDFVLSADRPCVRLGTAALVVDLIGISAELKQNFDRMDTIRFGSQHESCQSTARTLLDQTLN